MKLYALIGENVGHSLSPQIHNHIFDFLKVDASYSAMQIKKDDFPNAIEKLKNLGYSGINVTIPYKETIIPYLDNISDEAKIIGAVNTVIFKDDKTFGYNTDYYGFKLMLDKESIYVENKNIVVLGTGGSAKTIICYLKDSGARSISVVYRNEENLNRLKEVFPFIRPIYLENQDDISGNICINATPVGMYPHTEESFLNEEIVKKFTVCIDIVYNPIKTKFLKTAEKNNIKVVNGLYMLIYQAVKAQELFQDTDINRSITNEIYPYLTELLQ